MQSAGQFCAVSVASHIPLPHTAGGAPQSFGHVVMLSPGWHMPSPQTGAAPQSFGQDCCDSPGPHMPLPQLPVQRFVVCLHWPEPHAASQHRSPVVHVVASASAVCAQPLALSQLSAVQGLPSSQMGPGITQAPLGMQDSPVVHTLPSSHGVPGVRKAWLHLPLVQASEVHVLPSLHVLTSTHSGQTSWPEAQLPLVHRSLLVHGLPSSQGMPLPGVFVHWPVAISQLSIVQTLPSSHAGVPLHCLFAHLSFLVQGLPSSQFPPSDAPWHGLPPQSCGQELADSPASHLPLPHWLPPPLQSLAQFCWFSPFSQVPLPHTGEQSAGQLFAVSVGWQVPSPQLALLLPVQF